MTLSSQLQSWAAVLAYISPVLAQTSTTMPPPSTTNTGVSSTNGPISSSTIGPMTPVSENDFTSFFLSYYTSVGLKPAAASYILEQEFGLGTARTVPKNFQDASIETAIDNLYPPSEAAALATDDLHRLSEQAYLVTLLPSELQAQASTFYSVFYSLQGITANASEADRVRSLAQYRTAHTTTPTRSSTGAAPGKGNVISGAVMGICMGLLGFL